jgi:hypothetical protein
MQASLRNCRNQASDAKGEAQGPKPRGNYRVGGDTARTRARALPRAIGDVATLVAQSCG